MQLTSPAISLPRSGSASITPLRGGAVASRYADQSHPKEVFGDFVTKLEDAKALRPRKGSALGRLLDVSLILLPIPLGVMVLSVLACRHIDANVGFSVGESFRTCARDDIAKCRALLDSRVTMLVRQSRP